VSEKIIREPLRGERKRLGHEALDELTFEVALLFFRMRVAATQYLGQGRHSSGRRSILKSLGARGPQTVPAMAKPRAVSRQHVQKLVDELKRDALVAAIPNPTHKRSKLIALTGRGAGFLEKMEKREAELFRFLGRDLRLGDIRSATELVRELRRRFESEEWLRLTGNPTGPNRSSIAAGRKGPVDASG
jgi:DNA-binding MarR family transcriptional regulator